MMVPAKVPKKSPDNAPGSGNEGEDAIQQPGGHPRCSRRHGETFAGVPAPWQAWARVPKRRRTGLVRPGAAC